MDKNQRSYVPALGHQRLTFLYDPLMRFTLRESTFKPRLVEQARIEPGHRVLDLGCGTGTLTLLIKKTHPEAEVVGLDADSSILTIAYAKAARNSLNIPLNLGLASALPYPDNSFDRVLSSLLLHRLSRENKRRALQEVFRVLRPDGELHIADWGEPGSKLLRAGFLLVQVLDGFASTADNVNGLLPTFLIEAGFREVRQTATYATIFGTLALLQGRKSA